MAWDAHSNFSKGTLTNSPGTAGTSFILGTGEGALFAANTPVTLVPDNTRPDKNNSEIGYVTAVASDTLTITRTQQGSTNQNVQAGWLVLGTITAKALTDIETAVDGKAASSHTHTASNITDFNTAADARITNAVGTTVQAYDADLTAFAAKTAPTGAVVGTTDTQTLTNKTLTTPVIEQIKATNGTIAFSNAAVASAVNYVELQGAATGAGPIITVGGSDTNADLVLQGKGTGLPKVFKSSSAREIVTTTGTETLSNKTLTAPKIANAGFIADANGNEEIIFTTTASAVNEITVANAATTGKPSISATGGDTNVSLNLVPKGTGTVQANGVDVVTTSDTQTLTNKTLTSPFITSILNGGTKTVPTGTDTFTLINATQTLANKTLTAPKIVDTGFIADANGNEEIIFTTTASAVNEITLANAATGGRPTISATGGDTNIDLGLAGKGTGAPTVTSTNGFGIVGSASTPATPATNVGKYAMSGTSSVRPTFINSSGTVEKVLTDKNSMTSTAATASVATTESTTSTTYADLTTTTDTVTVTVGPSGVVLVSIVALIYSTGVIGDNYVSFALSGANTSAATDTRSISNRNTAGISVGGTFILTGLTAGSTTFKMKYRTSAGTGNYLNRNIGVVPL